MTYLSTSQKGIMFQKILEKLQINELNSMQLASLESSRSHADIVLLAPTGSGKTLAFLLPVLHALDQKKKGVQALVLVPSRELAMQIEQVFKQMGVEFKVNCCYGGHPTRIEKNNLSHPPALLVGTPGRIAYHLRNKNFEVNDLQTLVLDEFDKSLELGFMEDMSEIIRGLTHLRKRLLISATSMDEIPEFTGVKRPQVLNYLHAKSPTKSELKVKFIRAFDTDKLETLFSLMCFLQNKPTLVFCNHRDSVDRISALLKEKSLAHGVFHGGMEQEDREKALIKFRNGSHRILVTTDLASRGLDIPEIDAVVHYQLPTTIEVFTHRNGRTARMNADGTAYMLLSAKEFIPPFIPGHPEAFVLPVDSALPPKSQWQTLYIGAGKKDKINKMDIVGMLLKKGQLAKEELGRVEVMDTTAYVAVRSNKVQQVLKLIKDEKIKNRKIKIEISA
ncbi:MAG: DEAD/DEAH box helicase [Flavobacteriales bacterium]